VLQPATRLQVQLYGRCLTAISLMLFPCVFMVDGWRRLARDSGQAIMNLRIPLN
jgi:hypothetical protein